MSHMIADSQEELLKMAKDIGVNVEYIQYQGTPKEHFDVCKWSRLKAISLGAVPVTVRELVSIIKHKSFQSLWKQ